MDARIVYFEKPGKDNTDAVLEIAKQRAHELGIKTVVIASNHGYTADKAVRLFDGVRIIVVGNFANPTMERIGETFSQGDEKLIRSKATVLITTHLLAGVSAAMRKRYTGVETSEIIGATLKMIGAGIKVAIECTVMAADAGLVRTDEDVIAIGGTRGGADSAIIVTPVNSQDLFDLRIKEILCKPLVGDIRKWPPDGYRPG